MYRVLFGEGTEYGCTILMLSVHAKTVAYPLRDFNPINLQKYLDSLLGIFNIYIYIYICIYICICTYIYVFASYLWDNTEHVKRVI